MPHTLRLSGFLPIWICGDSGTLRYPYKRKAVTAGNLPLLLSFAPATFDWRTLWLEAWFANCDLERCHVYSNLTLPTRWMEILERGFRTLWIISKVFLHTRCLKLNQIIFTAAIIFDVTLQFHDGWISITDKWCDSVMNNWWRHGVM